MRSRIRVVKAINYELIPPVTQLSRMRAYFVLDANASYALTDWARVTLQVNNVLDNDEIRPSGYSYLYFTGERLSGTAYYYPHATRNAVVLLDLGF